MRTPAREAWLSLTPEPERDLPDAIATLRAGGSPSPEQIQAERDRAEELVLRGNRRRWLAWLNEGLELAADSQGPDTQGTSSASRPGVQMTEARAVLYDVLENHHALEQGLPERARSPVGHREEELLERIWARNRKGTE